MTTKVKASVLENTTVTAGTYGSTTTHSTFTVDAQGRLTAASSVTPSIDSTLTISSPLTGTSYNGSAAVSIGITAASSGVSGYLTGTDWTTFNNKQAAGNYATGGGTATGTNTGDQTTVSGTAAGLSATLVVGSGGTGVTTTPTSGGIVYGASASTQGYSAAGTSGQVLTSGVAGVPLWKTLGGLGISEFVAGTALLFQQTAAPTGWTKVTTHNDKSLRIVSGTVSSGGTVAFSTAFASKTPAGTVSVATSIGTLAVGIGTLAGTIGTLAGGAVTLTTAQIPSHTHSITSYMNSTLTAGSYNHFIADSNYPQGAERGTLNINSTGGGGSHTHGLSGSPSLTGSPTLTGSPSITSATFTGTAIDLAVQYVDVIIATKN